MMHMHAMYRRTACVSTIITTIIIVKTHAVRLYNIFPRLLHFLRKCIYFVTQSTFKTKKMENAETIKNSIFNSVGLKLALIAFLSLLLLIPTQMIISLIGEREQRSNETINEVTSIWGNEQTLTGPVLTIQAAKINSKGETVTRYLHFLPDNLNITGTITPQVRHRSIYKVVTYNTRLHVTGEFLPPDIASLQVLPSETENALSWVEIGIPDMRGIKDNIVFHWGDSSLQVVPGIPSKQVSESGVHVPVRINSSQSVKFSFDINLNGSNSLNFSPLGRETSVDLASSWNAPKFKGAFLPEPVALSDSGFNAHWKILQLNRNYPQQWADSQFTVNESSFGVDLITQVATYQKSMRSAKYAILFIVLTFIVFFFAEIMTGTRIHPFNYLLVGISLCVFYSLLTALAEYIPFSFAYLAACISILSLVSVFAHSLYKKKQVTLTVTVTLSMLYIYLYVILQLANYSLLIGNIGLLFIIALIMYYSRKIDWYSPFRTKNQVN
jgi:inner membrane protein